MTRRMKSVVYICSPLLVLFLVVTFIEAPLVGLGITFIAATAVLRFTVNRSALQGVALLGAVAFPVIVPPLYTPLPGFTGMMLGALWLVVFCVNAETRFTDRSWLLLFVPVVLGVLWPVLDGQMPDVSVVVLYGALVGLISGRQTVSNRNLVHLGLITFGVIEAGVCITEFIVFRGDPLNPDSGLHPLYEGTRTEGTAGHGILAGIVILVALALVLSRPMRPERRWPLVLVLVAGIVPTGSSSVYVGAILCFAYPLLVRGHLLWRLIKILIATAAGIYVLFVARILDPVIADVSGVNSTHRLNSITSMPNLVTERPILESLFGSGWGSERANYLSGALINDNFYTLDNMFATVLMASGLIGLALFVVLVVTALAQSDSRSRLPLIAVLLMFFSFDVLLWASSGAIFALLAFGASRPGTAIETRFAPHQTDLRVSVPEYASS